MGAEYLKMKLSLPITLSLHISNINIGHVRLRNLEHPLRAPHGQASLIPQEANLSPITGGWGNFMHTINISLGTPPQSFSALLDLASSALLIPSVNHTKTAGSTVTPWPQYNSTLSSTFRPNGTAIISPFMHVNVSGYLSYDDLHISSLLLSHTLFQEAPSWHPLAECLLCDRPTDTLFPLGPYNVSAPRSFISPIAQLIEAEILDKNIFSLRLSRNPGDGEGQLVLGGMIDEELYTGEFTTIPMTSLPVPDSPSLDYVYDEGDKWKTTISSLTVGRDAIKHTFSIPTIAIIDVGVPYIGLPASLAEDINELLETDDWGPFGWAECEDRDTFPNVTIILHDEEFVLTPYDYLLEQRYPGDDELYCQSAFMAMFGDEGHGGKDEGVVVLGSAFVKAWVSVFDLETGDMSFARAKHDPLSHEAGHGS